VGPLNYHHLRYFWTVARLGSIRAASRELALSQPPISAQLKQLEDALGEKLFVKHGRGLALTEAGQIALRYADEIFGTGLEMLDALRGRSTTRPAKLLVGVSDVIPKLIAHLLIAPALRLTPAVQVVCREDKTDRLLAELSTQSLDLVLADAPITGQVKVRAYNHLLGESPLTFFAAPKLKKTLGRRFPDNLDGAPLLLPAENTVLRRALDPWLERHKVRPRVIAEFDDSALLKVFAQHGEGVFSAPSVIEREIRKQYEVVPIGRTKDITERFYAITVERRIRHPAVVAISEAARSHVFAK
jgi:LysR family transcriptional regulator, transcriptional activator of nhaA